VKEIIVKLSVPDELDPYDVLNNMIDDFYYSNKSTEDYGPHLENIFIQVQEEANG
jgi:hypothetical protein